MLNPWSEVNWHPDRAARRRFAVSLIIGFPIVAGVMLLALHGRTGGWPARIPLVVGLTGAGLGMVLWLVPAIARPFHVTWHAVGGIGGFVVGNTLLAAVYLCGFTPLGLARRALGRSGLRRGLDRQATSYWREAPPPPPPESYYRQF